MTALTTIDHRESRSLLRMLLFNESVPGDLKLHAAMVLRMQGINSEDIMPARTGLGEGFMPDARAMMARLGVGERQLVRYADEVLQREYGVSALTHLLLIWSAYRQLRGTSMDLVRCVGGGAAALAYSYLLVYGPKPDVATLAKQFGCDARQLVYYARRIASCLDRIAKEN